MVVLFIIFSIEILFIVTMFLLVGQRYKEFILINAKEFQLPKLAPISLYILDKSRFGERFPKINQKIYQKMSRIYGNKHALTNARVYLAEMISFIFISITFFTVMALLANGDRTTLIIGLLITATIPSVMIRRVDRKIQKKEQAILFELPDFLDKLTLLVNAGETLQGAMIRCVEQQEDIEGNPLYIELRQVVNELKLNHSLQKAIEGFNQRCSVMEASIFTTTILLNYRRGGEELVEALRSLSRDLWEKRKSLTKTLGEEASSKLVFPMVLIFVVVMLIVASPAIMIMN
jgi:tight adherence protein C